jgi:hypothetical protein
MRFEVFFVYILLLIKTTEAEKEDNDSYSCNANREGSTTCNNSRVAHRTKDGFSLHLGEHNPCRIGRSPPLPPPTSAAEHARQQSMFCTIITLGDAI